MYITKEILWGLLSTINEELDGGYELYWYAGAVRLNFVGEDITGFGTKKETAQKMKAFISGARAAKREALRAGGGE